ncbi:MAG: Cas9 inhibitor AcrIIA9 family protein [Candidatus Coproplasma sp.]
MKFVSLNLLAKNRNEELIKHYLEENASEVLADKINNGVQITVKDSDGIHTVVNKKTLSGFWKFATEKARKLATGSCAAVEDEVVFGWAIHYFEEDSIEGDLYKLDGTRFTKKTKQEKTQKEEKAKPVKETPKPVAKPKKPVSSQVSLFDAFADDTGEDDGTDESDSDIEPEEGEGGEDENIE